MFLFFFLDSLLIFLVIQGSCCLTDFVCGIILPYIVLYSHSIIHRLDRYDDKLLKMYWQTQLCGVLLSQG